jgi:hypothetical protein
MFEAVQQNSEIPFVLNHEDRLIETYSVIVHTASRTNSVLQSGMSWADAMFFLRAAVACYVDDYLFEALVVHDGADPGSEHHILVEYALKAPVKHNEGAASNGALLAVPEPRESRADSWLAEHFARHPPINALVCRGKTPLAEAASRRSSAPRHTCDGLSSAIAPSCGCAGSTSPGTPRGARPHHQNGARSATPGANGTPGTGGTSAEVKKADSTSENCACLKTSGSRFFARLQLPKAATRERSPNRHYRAFRLRCGRGGSGRCHWCAPRAARAHLVCKFARNSGSSLFGGLRSSAFRPISASGV